MGSTESKDQHHDAFVATVEVELPTGAITSKRSAGAASVAATTSPKPTAIPPTKPSDPPPVQKAAELNSVAHTQKRPGRTEEIELIPGQLVRQYELIRQLGRGGMGVVFLARDTRLGRRVAIKFLSPDSAVPAERFLIEARATARCKHENIVTIYEAGEAFGRSYMVLEYLDGQTLRDWLAARAVDDDSISAAEAVNLILPIVRALVQAHDRGMVHRDLKPDNIMITSNAEVKVLDFGIAKLFDDVDSVSLRATIEYQASLRDHLFATNANSLVGTLPYMAPEQLRSDPVDARVDIWSVGILFWEILVGRHPLAPLTPRTFMTVEDLDIPMPSIADTRADLGALADVVDHCLKKQLDQRIPTAEALLTALTRLGDEPRPLPAARKTNGLDNPYVGLGAFQVADAPHFFGREGAVASLCAELRQHSVVTVAGGSGAGKSSFVRAGVIPALQSAESPWETFIVQPEPRAPLAALADLLIALGQAPRPASQQTRKTAPDANSREQLIATLRDQPGHLGVVLQAHAHTLQSRILLFVDQFEVLFLPTVEPAARAAFIACVQGLAGDASSPTRLLMAVRSDAIDQLLEEGALATEISRHLTILRPPSRAHLRAALIEPLAEAGYQFESQALVESILDSLARLRAPLPFLQLVAVNLWVERDRGRKLLTQASYDTAGGGDGILVRHADSVMAGLSHAEREMARVILLALTSEKKSHRVRIRDLQAMIAPSRALDFDRTLDRLVVARLLLIERDDDGGESAVLNDNRLAKVWPAIREWQRGARKTKRAAARQLPRGERRQVQFDSEKWHITAAAVAFVSLVALHFLDGGTGLLTKIDHRIYRAAFAAFQSAGATIQIYAGYLTLLALALLAFVVASKLRARQAERFGYWWLGHTLCVMAPYAADAPTKKLAPIAGEVQPFSHLLGYLDILEAADLLFLILKFGGSALMIGAAYVALKSAWHAWGRS